MLAWLPLNCESALRHASNAPDVFKLLSDPLKTMVLNEATAGGKSQQKRQGTSYRPSQVITDY